MCFIIHEARRKVKIENQIKIGAQIAFSNAIAIDIAQYAHTQKAIKNSTNGIMGTSNLQNAL